jgi:hypothetical protein
MACSELFTRTYGQQLRFQSFHCLGRDRPSELFLCTEQPGPDQQRGNLPPYEPESLTAQITCLLQDGFEKEAG